MNGRSFYLTPTVLFDIVEISYKPFGKGEQHMEEFEMTEKGQATILMDKFIDLQRIKAADDREKEIQYQLKTTKAKLEALGIVTEDLTID